MQTHLESARNRHHGRRPEWSGHDRYFDPFDHSGSVVTARGPEAAHVSCETKPRGSCHPARSHEGRKGKAGYRPVLQPERSPCSPSISPRKTRARESGNKFERSQSVLTTLPLSEPEGRHMDCRVALGKTGVLSLPAILPLILTGCPAATGSLHKCIRSKVDAARGCAIGSALCPRPGSVSELPTMRETNLSPRDALVS